MTEYMLCLLLMGVGVYGVTSKRNLLKIIVGIAVIGYSINLMLALTAARRCVPGDGLNGLRADPLAHSMALAGIVIGMALTILLASLAVRIYERTGTLDSDAMRRLKG